MSLTICRYSESIDFLYSSNTFDTNDADVIAFLPRILLPHRINKIRNVQILLSISLPPSYLPTNGRPVLTLLQPPEKIKQHNHYYKKQWNAIWKTLSEMEGLEILRVELTMHGRHDHLWEAEEFDCVQWLHRPRDISLLLPDTVARRMTGKIGMGNCTVKSSIEEDADQW
jgi:hypothetical protein